MSFHIIQRQRTPRRQPHSRRVSTKLVSNGKYARAQIIISGDLVAHLRARPGNFVRPLLGYGEDQGDFALERVTSRRDGFTLSGNPHARCAHFTVKASDFVPLTPGFTTVFDIELAEGRVICRAPDAAALAQAAE